MPLRILYISNLYPSAARPMAGYFQVPVFDRLADRCEIKVIHASMTSLLNPFSANPSQSPLTADRRLVANPTVYYLPKFGHWNGALFSAAVDCAVTEATDGWQPDVMFSSWLYPDAFGTLLQAQKRGLPFVCDAVGSDVNILMKKLGRRRQILRVARKSNAIITRSEALRQKLANDGIASNKITVLYNGVDPAKFRPLDRQTCAKKLGLDPQRPRILFVGVFLPVKNLFTLLDAFAHVRANGFEQTELILAGTGPLEPRLKRRMAELHTENAVRMTGQLIPHDEIPCWMNASDLLCLPSLNEGVPNVILEALACGLPIVASSVGGIPEVVSSDAGVLLEQPTNVAELSHSLQTALARNWDRAAIQRTSMRFSWEHAANVLYSVLLHASGQSKH
jgi:glycosyltransferase involved in cell wall biosynthesis